MPLTLTLTAALLFLLVIFSFVSYTTGLGFFAVAVFLILAALIVGLIF